MNTEPTQAMSAAELADIKRRADISDNVANTVDDDTMADLRRLLEEVDRLRAENTAQAARIDAAEKFARNWTGAPHEVTSQLDQYLQEDYGTTAIAHCGRAILTALGLDQDGRGQADADR